MLFIFDSSSAQIEPRLSRVSPPLCRGSTCCYCRGLWRMWKKTKEEARRNIRIEATVGLNVKWKKCHLIFGLAVSTICPSTTQCRINNLARRSDRLWQIHLQKLIGQWGFFFYDCIGEMNPNDFAELSVCVSRDWYVSSAATSLYTVLKVFAPGKLKQDGPLLFLHLLRSVRLHGVSMVSFFFFGWRMKGHTPML